MSWRSCRIGSCQRHCSCMYAPCRSAIPSPASANPQPPVVDRPPTTSSVVDREGGDNGYQGAVELAAEAITETGLLDGDEAMSAARAALSAMPTPDAIRAETTAQVVAWLRTYPSVIGLDKMAAWNTAAHIERGEHLTGGGE